LRELGHEVCTYSDYSNVEVYQWSFAAKAYRKIARQLWEPHRRRHVRGLVELAERERPHVVIILKGLPIGPADVIQLKRTGAWTVVINHDDFFTQNPNNRSKLQRAAIAEYDFVFTTREVNVEELRPFNSRVEFFPFAYYPRIHRPLRIAESERELWDVDVVFVGTWEKQRGEQLEELVRLVPAKYSIWGPYWEKVKRGSPLTPFLHHRPIIMDEMAKAIGGAKVALAFLRKENRDDYTQRTFEIPACNGVLVAERTRRHLQFYNEGTEAEFFEADSNEQLVEKVSLLLADNAHRERLRGAGRAALLRQRHTYKDRLTRLLEIYASDSRCTSDIASDAPEQSQVCDAAVPSETAVKASANQRGRASF
jgi:glycosyltransferase involved in cell wall biosynthesis